ncbi:hypothetical protein [Moritella sp. PE36]|uniref:RipA family octameric membrane protein n=1 Tax=Moritella sp. PE36 TaxID=58051 RepID=UPI0012F82A12|nr:hypothetical protein [Moritella sp. PE36]
MEPEEINSKLYASGNIDAYDATNSYNAHLLEQYKIYLTSAENISNRRQTANSFFVTVNTALISLISYLNLGVATSSKLYWVISLAGIAISYMWYRLVRSYKDLNSAKFKVIHEIEKSLPISPYDAEWEAVGRGGDPKLYLPFTHIEIYVPWVFVLLHFIVFVISSYPKVSSWLFCVAS